MGLNFVTISLQSSYVKKNQCLCPFVFFFFVFFLLFIFFFFSFFVHFFMSLIFLMFFIFHFFWRKKFLLSLFSCMSFKFVVLLALVSEFNCFLRCRCSMEMWCPHDTGRDSLDWVGPPAWERACFNTPEWGGGSSPVKTEPLQIVLLLLLLVLWLWLWLFLTRSFTSCVCPHDGDMNWHDPVTTGLNSKEEAEKCRTELRKNLSMTTQLSPVKLEKVVSSFPSANCAKQNCNQKHRLSTLLPSTTERRATLQDSSLPQRGKCVQFVQTPSTDAEHVSTVKPSIAPTSN